MSFDPSMSGAGPLAAAERLGKTRALCVGAIAAMHAAALGIMLWTEHGWFAPVVFVLSWACVNFLLLLLLPRPAIAAALSLVFVGLLITLSHFKFTVLWMVINFFDVLIVDSDTISFLLSIFPDLKTILLIAAVLAVPALIILWRIDMFRVPRLVSLGGVAACSTAITVLSLAVPEEPSDQFQGVNHVSTFFRSGVTTAYELSTKGWIDYDTTTTDQLRSTVNAVCQPNGKPPNIIMVLDEASYDITASPGVKVPPDYRKHFQSFDGKTRSLVVEGSGGPTWYTEYNVLTGLSVKSFGRFADFVTRIAAGRVERGLPRTLARCGYKTFSLYPMYGLFAGARQFQLTTGIQRFLDARDLGSGGNPKPDRFYFDKALELMKRERGEQPLFMFVYTAANHFPWTYRYKPELTPEWVETGNPYEVDEYLRRQLMSIEDYPAFIANLKRELPGEPILIVRFGDHQPSFAKTIIDPALDETVIARRIAESDPRYITTYYAIDGINFRPANLSSALDTLDAPYLPLMVLEAAGLPLDPAFAEQKRILKRCNGLFYRCGNGAEARRFNRLLIDAGLIKGL
jgi:hypothetical protein